MVDYGVTIPDCDVHSVGSVAATLQVSSTILACRITPHFSCRGPPFYVQTNSRVGHVSGVTKETTVGVEINLERPGIREY